MSTHSENFVQLIAGVLEKQKENIRTGSDFCCGSYGQYQIFENDKIKIVFSDKNQKCEVKRKKNNNPVFMRDEEGNIIRFHGEHRYLIKEMQELSGLNLYPIENPTQYD